MELISQGLRESLCAQWVHEKENASIYLFIAGFLRNKGLDNIAKIFTSQYDEENKHSMQIFDLLTDMNTAVSIQSIPTGNFPITNCMDIANKFLQREVETTAKLQKIRDESMGEGNSVVEEFLRGMIMNQLHELEECSTFMDKVSLFEGDWKFVALWNESLK